MKKTLLTITMLLALAIKASIAQDFHADMKKMQEAFGNQDDFHLKMTVTTYANGQSTTPSSVSTSEAMKKGDNYRYQMGNITTLINERCILVLNKDESLMVYSPTECNEELMAVEEIELDFDPQAISEQAKGKDQYLGLKDGLKHYKISARSEIANHTELFIHPDTYLPKKVVYQFDPKIYAGGNKVVIDFVLIDAQPTFDRKTFSELEYVAISKKGATTPLDQFKNYDFVINKYPENE